MKLKDQSIIVTGGASGIGHQAGLALAAEGANVIVADFNLDGATKAAAELTQLGVKAFPFKVDVSKAADVEAMVNFAVGKLGSLNGISNNAGIGLVKPSSRWIRSPTSKSSRSISTACISACTTPRRRWSLSAPGARS